MATGSTRPTSPLGLGNVNTPGSELEVAIERFLKYLQIERNASPYTLKSYREDLNVLVAYLRNSYGGTLPDPGSLSTLDLRGYSASLQEAGYS